MYSQYGYTKRESELICWNIENWLVNAINPERRGPFVYFSLPKFPLKLYVNNYNTMTITTFEGALRIYKRLSGQKPTGFEQYGREIYF